MFNKLKKRPLTPSETIQLQQNKVQNAFGMFTKLRDDIVESNEIISDAMVETEKRIASLKAQINNEYQTLETGGVEIQVNSGMLKKIEEFIPSSEGGTI